MSAVRKVTRLNCILSYDETYTFNINIHDTEKTLIIVDSPNEYSKTMVMNFTNTSLTVKALYLLDGDWITNIQLVEFY